MLSLFNILCLMLLWIAALIIYFVIETFKLTKYYGTVKSVEFFKTSKQYKTFLLVKTRFEEKLEGGSPGNVIAHFSAILPETHLKKHLNYNPDIVIDRNGTLIKILYLDYSMKRLLIEALQDWFPEDNVEIGIKMDEVDDQPSTEEREYVLFDVNHHSIPYYSKRVSQDDFLLIYCQSTNFPLKVGETVLDNVEAYVKITPDMLNRSLTAMENNRVIKEARLHAYQLDRFHETEEEISNWIDKEIFCRNSYFSLE